MKKRLLCYDEDNPVGIDENGVLNPSALGGGPLFRIFHNQDAPFSEDDNVLYFVDKELCEAIKNAYKGKDFLPIVQFRDATTFMSTVIGEYKQGTNQLIYVNKPNDGGTLYTLWIFETYEEAFNYHNR